MQLFWDQILEFESSYFKLKINNDNMTSLTDSRSWGAGNSSCARHFRELQGSGRSAAEGMFKSLQPRTTFYIFAGDIFKEIYWEENKPQHTKFPMLTERQLYCVNVILQVFSVHIFPKKTLLHFCNLFSPAYSVRLW